MNNVYLQQLETCISDVSHPSNVQPPKIIYQKAIFPIYKKLRQESKTSGIRNFLNHTKIQRAFSPEY